MHNGQSQRSDLIQSALDPNYLKHPVESTAKGGDQTDVFPKKWEDMPTCPALSARMKKNALSTLGKGKLLNERGQRVLHLNLLDYRGEQNLWERIHASVWHTGISFARQLSEQGFSYLPCPAGISSQEYNMIQKALSSSNFLVDGTDIITDGYRLPTHSLNQFYCDAHSIIQLDPELTNTFQPNGLVINLPEQGGRAPLGWILHKESKKIIPQEFVEESMRIIRLARGGYHELTPQEQALLSVGPKNGMGGVTQSPVFNALFTICNHLEQEYGFDPQKLLGNSISTSYNQVQAFFLQPENVEDFLTGPLLTEMIQPLKISQEYSARKREIPPRLTYSFKTLNNTTKAIAHAYSLQYKGMPLLKLISIKNSPFLPDVSIHGNLALPSLSFGKQSAAVLSTALLVAEQMFLEQILRNASRADDVQILQELLNQIMENPQKSAELAHKLISLSKLVPHNELGPILGLQFGYCDEMIALIRDALHFDSLIQFLENLEEPGILTQEALQEFLSKNSRKGLDQGLLSLYRLGHLMQQIDATDVQCEGSRGINAGLIPLIRKIAPSLLLGVNEVIDYDDQVPEITRAEIGPKPEKKSEKPASRHWVQTSAAVILCVALLGTLFYAHSNTYFSKDL
jgi:hypothetical protein